MISNKMFKNCMTILLATLFILIATISINRFSINKTNELFNYTDSYNPLRIPIRINTSEDYTKLITALNETSNELKIPFLKKVVNEGLTIRSGLNFIFLPKTEITLYTSANQPNQKEIYSPPLSTATFQLSSIQKSMDLNEFEGEIFLKTNEKDKYDQFVKLFSLKFNTLFNSSYSIKSVADFGNSKPYKLGLYTDVYRLDDYRNIGVLFLSIILLFYILSVKKRIFILRTNGFSIPHIFNSLFAGKSLWILLTVLILSSSSLYKYKEIYLSYFLDILFLLLWLYFWTLVVLFLVTFLLFKKRQHPIFTKLKNSAPFFIKLIFLLILTVTSTDLAQILAASFDLFPTSETRPTNIAGETYKIFSPVTLGKNTVEFIYDDDFGKIEEEILYEELIKSGSILVNMEGYNISKNELFGRDIRINPNYLAKFPIYDEHGKRVLIQENEPARILLVPEKFKDPSEKNNLETIEDYFFNILPDAVNTGTKFIFIKDNQSVFTFTSKNTWVKDYPMLNVLTLENSDFWFRNIIYGDSKLNIRTDTLSSSELQNLLVRTQTEDNLQSFIPYEKAEITLLKMLTGSMFNLVILTAITLFTYIIVSLLTSILYFQTNKRKLSLLRLNGYSFFTTYAQYFTFLLIQVVVALTIAAILSEINIEFTLNIIIASLLDIGLSIFLLSSLEKKEKIKILSGW